jgi:Transposase DDE domain group 1
MSQGLLPYTVEAVERADTVTGRAGLPLVLETMRALRLDQAIAQHLHVRERQSGYTEAEKVEALVLLLAAGGDCLDDIAVLQADGGLGRLLGRRFPSADALRHFLYAFHDEQLLWEAQTARPVGQVAYIPAENAALQGLARVNTALVHQVAAQGKSTTATLDHDATLQESHKRAALPHYQGGRGYQPTAVYWGEQDLVVADEYRDGNVGAGMATLPLIQRAFASLPPTVTTLAFRADTACYDERTLQWLADPARPGGPMGPIGFTIGADMTKELHAVCAAAAEATWQRFEDRPDETVHCTEVEFTPGDWPKRAAPLRYVALRIQKKQGQLFASGVDTKYLAIVSNRWELAAPQLLRWHWEKAGTIELVHAITKNELGAAVPPCGRFGANAAWYRLSLLTYNVLSALKSLALPPALSAARPKRLRFTLFTLAGRLVAHAGRLVLRVSAAAERLAGLIAARERLVLVAQALPAG